MIYIKRVFIAVFLFFLTSTSYAVTCSMSTCDLADIDDWKYVNDLDLHFPANKPAYFDSVAHEAEYMVKDSNLWYQSIFSGMAGYSRVDTLGNVIAPGNWQTTSPTNSAKVAETGQATVNIKTVGCQPENCTATTNISQLRITRERNWVCKSGSAPQFVNGVFYCPRVSCKITAPAQSSMTPLLINNYTAATVGFQAVDQYGYTGIVDWVVDVFYSPNNALVLSDTNATRIQTKFQSSIGALANIDLPNQGGRMTINATYTSDIGLKATCPTVTSYIVGNKIPSTITIAYLKSIYPGPTPDMLVKIGVLMSGLNQFSNNSLTNFRGVAALWPHLDLIGGFNVGIMQVTTNMANAWSWKKNADYGLIKWNARLSDVAQDEGALRAKYPGLPALTAQQREKMVLAKILRNPAGLLNQYYKPVQVNGAWQWTENLNCSARSVVVQAFATTY